MILKIHKKKHFLQTVPINFSAFIATTQLDYSANKNWLNLSDVESSLSSLDFHNNFSLRLMWCGSGSSRSHGEKFAVVYQKDLRYAKRKLENKQLRTKKLYLGWSEFLDLSNNSIEANEQKCSIDHIAREREIKRGIIEFQIFLVQICALIVRD